MGESDSEIFVSATPISAKVTNGSGNDSNSTSVVNTDWTYLQRDVIKSSCAVKTDIAPSQAQCILVLNNDEDNLTAGLQSCVKKLYFLQDGAFPPENDFYLFDTPSNVIYTPLCDDFGPMGLLSIFHFIEQLDEEITTAQPSHVVYAPGSDNHSLTNAVFLLGAYILMKLNLSPDDIWQRFRALERDLVPFRDASHHQPPASLLTVLDCWRGLHRAKELGWVALPAPDAPGEWGMYDATEYAHYGSPLHGDLHEVIPDRLIAFKGPRGLDGAAFRDSDGPAGRTRAFGPEFYRDLFRASGVVGVVRLNEPHYDGQARSRHKNYPKELVYTIESIIPH